MASSTGYDTGVRQTLLGKGVSNADIGYNSANGYVTVKGQDFLKPAKVLNGASYDTLQNFNNAWANYNKAQTPSTGTGVSTSSYTPKSTVPTGSVAVRSGLQSAGYDPSSIGYSNGAVTLNNQPFMTPSYNIDNTAYATPGAYNSALSNYRINDTLGQVANTKLPDNPYTQQISDQIAYLMNLAQNPQTVDPYSTPEYAAYEAQAQKAAGQNVRAAQESLGSSGFGRSTMLSDRTQGIQNDATEYLNTQVVPQIIASNQAKQQQQYNQILALLDPLLNQQSYADNRAQTEYGNSVTALGALTGEQQRGLDNRRADASLTGNYLTTDQQNAIDALLSLKSQAEAKGTTAAQRTALSTQADAVRSQLQALGIDPSLYGSNVNLATARQAQPGRTLAGQQLDLSAQQQSFNQQQELEQFAYQKARDAIADKQWQTKFDEDVRQYGLSYGLQQLGAQNDEAYRRAQLALSQDDNLRAWTQLDYDQSQPAASKYVGMTASQVLDNIKSLYTEPVYTTDPLTQKQTKTGEQLTKDPTKRTEMFESVVDAGLSEAETKQILLSLGYTMRDIETRVKQYSGN
ncbi:hypothetical protein D3C71_971640 [compost metagenome]